MISFQLQSGIISVCKKNPLQNKKNTLFWLFVKQIRLWYYKLHGISPKIGEANSILSDLLSFDLSCWRNPLFFCPSDWFPSSSQSGQQRESLSRGDADGEAPALIVRGSWRSSCPWQPQRCRGHGRLWPTETQKQLFIVQNGQSGRCSQSHCFVKYIFWRVLQDRHRKWWPLTAKREQKKGDHVLIHRDMHQKGLFRSNINILISVWYQPKN